MAFYRAVIHAGYLYRIFGIFLQVKWAGTNAAHSMQLPLNFFIGLNFYNFFAEALNKSSALIRNQVNYVKKIVFPLEILPWVALQSSLIYTGVAFLIWTLFHLLFKGLIPLSAFYVVLLFVPLTFWLLGCMYFISALSVYLKDITPLLSFIVTAFMFLSPVFYSVNTMAESTQYWLCLNPLTFIIEQARACLLAGKSIAWVPYIRLVLLSLLTAFLGYKWFQRIKEGFADVL